MNEINEIKIPQGVESISVTQHDDKVVIEFMPKKSKFKAGDKVTLKKGCSSKNALTYLSVFDEFAGKELTINKCINGTFVGFDETNYIFYEDWLEPYTEELKKGDLAIFWDDTTDHALIRIYDKKGHKYHYDSSAPYGSPWENAIKFESKEQFEKVLRGGI